MQKVEIAIPPEDWGTLKSKYAPDLKKVLVHEFTRNTANIDTQVDGAISKRRGGITYNPTPLAAPLKDQYEAIFSDGVRHLLGVQSGEIEYTSGDRIWNTVVNGTGFTPGANFEFELADDRVYGDNGVNAPIVYDRTTLYGGVVYTAPRVRPMGAQAPSTAPTAGAPTAGGNVPNGAHTYKVTFVYYGTSESNGSPSSGVQTAATPNNTIPLSAIPIGGYGVTARKIYRDDNDGNYVLVGTLNDNTTLVFNDTALAGTTPLPIDQGLPPTFAQIVLFLDRLFIAQVPGTPSVVYFSEPGMYDIFPGLNFIICNQKDPIVAIVVYQDRIIVFNRQSMGQILGRTSDQFAYSHIPGSVGCIDNRTIQTRTVDGVPVLVWLSDRGFYTYNGSSIVYISQDIEDQVNLNIQQASQPEGSHTDDTQTQFQEGTASGGIDLVTFPGIVTTPNPKRVFDDQADWESGSTTSNIVTKAGDNKLKAPIRFLGTLTDGALTPEAIIVATDLTLPFYNGEDNTAATSSPFGQSSTGNPALPSKIGQRITPSKNGTIDLLKIRASSNTALNTITLSLYTDVLGTPGTSLFTSGNLAVNQTTSTVLSVACSVSVTANTAYWIVSETTSVSGTTSYYGNLTGFFFNGVVSNLSMKEFSVNNGWTVFTGYGYPAVHASFSIGYHINYFQSGQWLSAVYDTLSAYISPTLNISHTGSYPSLTSAATQIEGSDDPTFTGGPEVFEVVNNLNGNSNISISGKRYWRIRITISSTSSNVVPVVGTPTLKFNQTATWVSPSIDATSDVVSYDFLDIINNIPAGTSIVYTVATSANDISYPDGFVPFGTEVTRRYIRIRAILTVDSTFTITPDISSITLKWTITANLISDAIDTGLAPPAGWGVFSTSQQLNGGTLVYQMRSASSLILLSSATFYTVTPGAFPPVTVVPFQFTQWKVIITSTADNVPQVDSVTVRWFINITDSTRCASIFVEGRYFVSAERVGSLTNDIIFELDIDGLWRIHLGLEVSTFSFFFASPYYGSANVGTLFKFLQGYLDDEIDNILIDIRTKAFDFSSKYGDESNHYKTLYECTLNGIGTGAAYTLQYSVDNGLNFIDVPTDTGTPTFISLNDGLRFSQRFRVNFEYGNIVSGKTLMIRITTDDEFNIEIHSLKIAAWIRKQI